MRPKFLLKNAIRQFAEKNGQLKSLFIILLIILIFSALGKSQNTCTTSIPLTYADWDPIPVLQTYTFADSILWFTFITDTSGKVSIPIFSDPDSSGAILHSLNLFDGPCNALVPVSTTLFSTNDTLSSSFSTLVSASPNFGHLKLESNVT